MKRMLYVLGTLLVCSGILFPYTIFAQSSEDNNQGVDITTTIQNAEQAIIKIIPPGVAAWFSKLFLEIETFRLNQVSIATTKRDALHDQVMVADEASSKAVEENRDAVLAGESSSLFSGMGDRLKNDVSFGLKAQYYAYRFYTAFVSSPLWFYVAGSFLIVYLLSTIFRGFRSRGNVE